MQGKCKQTTPFLFWSRGVVVCQFSPSHPPCLAKGPPCWLTNLVRIWAATNPATVDSPTENPTGCSLSSLWCRAVIWKGIFALSSSLFPSASFPPPTPPPPAFLTLFSSSFNDHPSLNPSFSNLKGSFKRRLVHSLKLSKGSSGKKVTVFLSLQLPKVIMSHVFDSIDRNT